MNPAPPSPPRTPGPPALIWWIIWAAISAGLVMIYVLLGRRAGVVRPEAGTVIDYVPIAPLVLSSLLRWLVFSRIPRAAAFPFFIAGLALAESCGIMGIFLSRHGTELFVLSLLGLLQWAPTFAGTDVRARDDAHGFR